MRRNRAIRRRLLGFGAPRLVASRRIPSSICRPSPKRSSPPRARCGASASPTCSRAIRGACRALTFEWERLARRLSRRSGSRPTRWRCSSRTPRRATSRNGSPRCSPARRSTCRRRGRRCTRRCANRTTRRSTSTDVDVDPGDPRNAGADARAVRRAARRASRGRDRPADPRGRQHRHRRLGPRTAARLRRAAGGDDRTPIDVAFVSNVDPEHLYARARGRRSRDDAVHRHVEDLHHAGDARQRRSARAWLADALPPGSDVAPHFIARHRQRRRGARVRHRRRRHPADVGLGRRPLFAVVGGRPADRDPSRLRRHSPRCWPAPPRWMRISARRRSSATCRCVLGLVGWWNACALRPSRSASSCRMRTRSRACRRGCSS